MGADRTGTGRDRWRLLDFVMPSAQKFGIKMLLSIAGAPPWAREPDAVIDRRGPPADPQAFAEFVAAILTAFPARFTPSKSGMNRISIANGPRRTVSTPRNMLSSARRYQTVKALELASSSSAAPYRRPALTMASPPLTTSNTWSG